MYVCNALQYFSSDIHHPTKTGITGGDLGFIEPKQCTFPFNYIRISSPGPLLIRYKLNLL